MRQQKFTLWLLACITFPLFFQRLAANGPPVPGAEEHDNPILFIENKGQWPDQVLFSADFPGGKLFIEENATFTYILAEYGNLHKDYFEADHPRDENFGINCHAYRVHFDGAGQPEALGGDLQSTYFNFFQGNDPAHWASHAQAFREVELRNVYPGIHFRIYPHETGLKYDLVLDEGAKVSDIRMVYEGLDEIKLKNKQILLKTSVGEVVEEEPVSTSPMGRCGDLVDVPSAYVLNGNVLSYALSWPDGTPMETVDRRQVTIDPTLIFSTYTGSTANNFGFSATYDDDGNLYAGGIAYALGYPTTLGAFQTTFGGGSFDVSLSKFDPTGGYLWGSYVGGTGIDQPHSMVVNHLGDLCFMGKTSSSDYPVSASCYDATFNGGTDFVVTRLRADGTVLLGSTYVGGTAADAENMTTAYMASSIKHNYGDDARGEIVVDADGEIYIAGCTKSSDFPATPGAFRTSNSGLQDGCVFKLNMDLTTMMWSTYLGGSGQDAAYGLKVDAVEGVYVTGGTESTNFPTTPGTLNPADLAGIDGFISHLNNTGSGMVKSTYIGTGAYDQCFFVELDNDGNVYLLGQSDGPYPVTAGVYSNPGSGQFITKLNPNLSATIFSTVFGNGAPGINISPTAFLVDVCGYLYASGWGGLVNFYGNTTGMPVSADAYQSTTDGSDLYVIVLTEDAAALSYATFMGGTLSNEHVDGGTSRFNKRAEIYQAVCAGCFYNSDFPMLSAYSTVNGNSCNLACFKMEFPLPGILADFTPLPAAAGCTPLNVFFDNNSVGGVNFFWDFDDAGATSTLVNPSHTFVTPGTYNVMLVAIDSFSCNIVDTAWRIITVYPQPTAVAGPDTTICAGDTITLYASGGIDYLWSPAINISSTTSSSPQVWPSGAATYTVIVTNATGCRDTATVDIGILPAPAVDAGPNTTICSGDSIQLNGSGAGSPSWSPGSTLSSTSILNPWAFPPSSSTYYLTITNAIGCSATDSVRISISTVTANAGPDQSFCAGDGVTLGASGGVGYQWSPGTGLSSTSISNPVATPTVSTTYTVTVTDVFGCTDTDDISITVHPLPVATVSPNVAICEGESVHLFAGGGSFFSWSPGTGLSSTTISDPFASPAATTTYVVTVTDANTCTDTAHVTVTVNPAPVANAGADAIICEDSLTQLNGSGGGSYLWSPAAGLSSTVIPNPWASPPITTDYILTVTAANGCDDTDTVRVAVTPTPQPNLPDTMIICLGQETWISATPSYDSYLWSTGETSSSIHVQPTTTTSWWVTVIQDGCPSEPDLVTVVVDDLLPDAAFDMSMDSGYIPVSVDFTNNSTNATSYYWIFGMEGTSTEENPSFTFTHTGDFGVWLIAYNANQCPDTAYRSFRALDYTIYVPNCFTNNLDGINDWFQVHYTGIKTFHVRIYDRWGMMIFESYDKDFRWDGSLHSVLVQEGVYTWVIEATSIKDNKINMAGNVTLLR